MRFAPHKDTPAAVLVALFLGACASAGSAPSLDAALAKAETPPAGVLRVRLAFGPGADLDVYVTDPRQETVYFANSPTRAGGVLREDLRCDAPAPRVEVVEFAAPPPGRYRVGVDYPKGCDGSSEPVAFVVELVHGARRELRHGTIPPLVFQPIVLEADVEPDR